MVKIMKIEASYNATDRYNLALCRAYASFVFEEIRSITKITRIEMAIMEKATDTSVFKFEGR